MPLFEIKSASLDKLEPSSFISEQILERSDLQRLLRDQPDPVAEGVLLIAEEFFLPNRTGRRVDLLGVDHEGHLVVIELKRTEDGGHLELQALRYAAMVSALTFDDLVTAHENYLRRVDPDAVDDARSRLVAWLADAGGEEAVISREVRIVLVSAGFDPEITTTVLWLNDIYGLDIRCVRLTLYRVDERLLLNVEQIIPLPEAADLTVQLRRRETRVRAGSSTRDLTRYVIVAPEGRSEPLPKRWAILALVQGLHRAGIPSDQLSEALGHGRFLSVNGILDGEELAHAFIDEHPGAKGNLNRWHVENPLYDEDRTWLLSNQWGSNMLGALDALVALAPNAGFGFEAASG